MKAMPRSCEGPGLNALMLLVFILREVQRNGSVRFAINELVDFRISAGANLFGRALGHDRAVTKHDHPRGDAKSAGHIVRDNDRRHVASMGQFDC